MFEIKGVFCEHCGQTLPDDVELRFCGECGAGIPMNIKKSAGSSISRMQMKMYEQNTNSSSYAMKGSIQYKGQAVIDDHPRSGLFLFLGILLGSAAFWVGGLFMITSSHIFRPFLFYIVLFVIGIIVISVTGKKEHRGRRIGGFVGGTLGSIIIWLVLGFLVLILLW